MLGQLMRRLETGRSQEYSVSSTLDLSVLLVHAGDEVTEAEVLDHRLEYGVLVNLDIVDLDFGVVGDEVHLALSFLL